MSEEVKRPVQGGKRIPKKKVCQFCVDKATEIDYKDVARLIIKPIKNAPFPRCVFCCAQDVYIFFS